MDPIIILFPRIALPFRLRGYLLLRVLELGLRRRSVRARTGQLLRPVLFVARGALLQRPELLLLQRRAALDLRERRDFESALRFAKSPLPILEAPACSATTLRFS